MHDANDTKKTQPETVQRDMPEQASEEESGQTLGYCIIAILVLTFIIAISLLPAAIN